MRGKGKHVRWRVRTFGHISGILSVQYAVKGEVEVAVFAGKKEKKKPSLAVKIIQWSVEFSSDYF